MSDIEIIEGLLKPRYKVIADAPFTNFKTGDVYTARLSYGNWIIDFIDYVSEESSNQSTDFFNQYPHLFQKLSWWEERKESDMPKYVKDSKRVLKVLPREKDGTIWHEDNTLEIRFLYPVNRH